MKLAAREVVRSTVHVESCDSAATKTLNSNEVPAPPFVLQTVISTDDLVS